MLLPKDRAIWSSVIKNKNKIKIKDRGECGSGFKLTNTAKDLINSVSEIYLSWIRVLLKRIE